MGKHSIRCRDNGEEIAIKLDGGACVCPPGECRARLPDTTATRAKPLPIVEVDEWPQYRHKKRGTTYTVMGRATLQAEGPLDNAKVVIYQSNIDGSMWVRPVSEFEDGRFERIHD